MIDRYSLLLVLFFIVSCEQPGGGPVSGEPVQTRPQVGLPNGAQAYEKTCARCHDEGLDGAPRIGHPEDWEGRSRLWEAVLLEHATDGYLGMPARGADETLDDATVARAIEYMLTQTFPDLPPD